MRICILAAALLLTPCALAQTKAPEMNHAKGTFDVKLAPTGHAPDPSLNSMSIDKVIHGDLEATTKGEMIAGGNVAAGAAGYVAIERVTGKLDGKSGSFAFMHWGTMLPGGGGELKIIVVPGSGTEELSGLYGTFTVTQDAAGKHSYSFDYAFSTK